jgi:hypothetical protein
MISLEKIFNRPSGFRFCIKTTMMVTFKDGCSWSYVVTICEPGKKKFRNITKEDEQPTAEEIMQTKIELYKKLNPHNF